jgi:hypothetical protein
MVIVKHIGVLSFAKVYAVILAIIGFIEGAFITVMSLSLGTSSSGGFASALGVFAIIALPIICAILGFVFGALGSFVYNVVASKIGGIDLDLK